MSRFPRRFDVYVVDLDPTRGSEVSKARPCVIVSPDQANRHIATVMVAPMITANKSYASRTPCYFDGKVGQIAVDQLRVVDKGRLLQFAGRISSTESANLLKTIADYFAAGDPAELR